MADSVEIPAYPESYLDSMGIEMPAGSGRPYLYSGTGTSFFYGTTGSIVSDGHMGFHWGNVKLWDDFLVTVNGDLLDRAEADVTFRPHMISFRWENGIVLTIKLHGKTRNDLQFLLSGAPVNSQLGFFIVFPAGVEIDRWRARKPSGFQTFQVLANDSDTLGIAIASRERIGVIEMRQREGNSSLNNFERYLVGKQIHGVLTEGSRFDLAVIYGTSWDNVADRWVEIDEGFGASHQEWKDWMLEEINHSYFRCSNEELNLALNWAKVSLAMLFAEDETLLYAGLPWFNEGWGRDTFISLPGACLVLGKYDAARSILERFAQWQDTDPESPDYGKIPNRARIGEIIYNTADGTPWFIRETCEYGLYSNDMELWREFWDNSVVNHAINGALRYRTDDNNLLVHGEADTWMDAVGPDGPWSPRGNRAVDIQALWIAQLQASIAMAEFLGEPATCLDTDEHQWLSILDAVQNNLVNRYNREDGLGLIDHINEDGSMDLQLRPNQLFALTVPFGNVFPENKRREIVDVVRTRMIYPYGVASLAQSDPNFHPYHHTHEYVQDAAYHNGIVWTWLSGAYKTASRNGWGIALNEVDQILNWGAPGTISENLDAVPREGNRPRTTGTVTQAWSLAEFIRTWYQDYLGFQPLAIDSTRRTFAFVPCIPEDWGDYTAIVDAGRSSDGGQSLIRIDGIRMGNEYQHSLQLLEGTGDEIAVVNTLDDREENSFELLGERLLQFTSTEILHGNDEIYLQPEIPEGLASLQPPPYPILSPPEAMFYPGGLESVIEVEDSTENDRGINGQYTYPTGAVFASGMLDITGFHLEQDDERYYFTLQFRNLVDPGWHSEYGFQLTFATLAIRTGERGQRRRDVGRNSGWRLERSRAADRFIHVGGGFQVEDGDGEILLMYIPTSSDFPLGRIDTKQIRFAIPKEYLPGNPDSWKITILSGVQDDHGGAGIGEFREVGENPGPWIGGGGGEGLPNVYDWIEVQ